MWFVISFFYFHLDLCGVHTNDVPGYSFTVYKTSVSSLYDFKTQICSIHTVEKCEKECKRKFQEQNTENEHTVMKLLVGLQLVILISHFNLLSFDDKKTIIKDIITTLTLKIYMERNTKNKQMVASNNVKV